MEKKTVSFKGVSHASYAAVRSKSIFTKQEAQKEESTRALEEQLAFLPPIPSNLAVNKKAIDQDIVQLTTDELVRFVASVNVSMERFRKVIKPLSRNLRKWKYHSALSDFQNAFQGTALSRFEKYLKAGPHIDDILVEEKEEEEEDDAREDKHFETNSPRFLVDSSDTTPIKKPRTRFMSTFFDDGLHGLTNLSIQLREMVRRGTTIFDKFLMKKPLEKVRYRAKDSRQSAVLPLQSAPKNNARWIFRMDVDDTVGSTAFFWSKWIHNRLPKRHVIAKHVVNSVIRFSIPNDLHSLEGLSVAEYLENYCDIDKDRMVIYETLHSRMKQMIVNVSSLKETVLKLITTNLTERSLDDLINLLNLPEDYAFKGNVFCKCLGLCERIFIPAVRSSDEKGGISAEDAENWKFQAGPLERLDFAHLSKRLADLKIEPSLRQLLRKLENQMNSQSADLVKEVTSSRPSEKTESRLFRRTGQSIRPPSESIKRGPTIRFVRH